MTTYKTFDYILVILFVTTTIILLLANTPHETIIIFCLFYALAFSVISLILKKNYIKSTNKINEILKKISEKYDIEKHNNFENKITELNKLQKEIENLKTNQRDKTLKMIYENLEKTTVRLTEELTNTKIFKINRNEFLGNVAHELRTPICAIQLSLETLINGAVKDDNVNTDFLKRALSHTNRLSELSNDLINISELEAGMKLSKRYLRINYLINEVVNSLHFISSSRKVEIETNFQIKDSTQVFCDSDAIKQVMMNLIDNAIKYTPEGGKILITTTSVDGEIFISVRDSGMGIPQEDIPRIFERFYRVDKTRSRDMGGSGLGLSIVKHIIELHNSKITVESKVGEGTEFKFGLPV
ncbi:MAG: two-component sensor histidine kinase [Ignavibacteria bacterium]|nr:two-component sensor histidine kinase [Ignavibacteria bacterium]